MRRAFVGVAAALLASSVVLAHPACAWADEGGIAACESAALVDSASGESGQELLCGVGVEDEASYEDEEAGAAVDAGRGEGSESDGTSGASEEPEDEGGSKSGDGIDAPADPAAPEGDVPAASDAPTGAEGDADAASAADPQEGAAAEATLEAAQTASLADAVPQGRWVVADLHNGYGLQRYWYVGNSYVVNRLVTPDEGAGYYAYATKYGYVVRGTYDNGAGRVYLADNDGRLETAEGWLVTGAYAGGVLQRYCIDGTTKAARTSYFTYGGANYFGLGGVGYVLRGLGTGVDGAQLYADNDGKLATNRWIVTDFGSGQGLQRYWFGSNSRIASGRLVDPAEGSGYWAYATSAGYVLRGVMDNGAGRVYLADNDGCLETAEGWLVTGKYTNGELQRYYIDSAAHAAKSSFFTVDGVQYYGLGGVGYVLRGGSTLGGQVFADNEGRLYGSGWVVTDALGAGLQRYWMVNGMFAVSRLVTPSEGAGYYAYATAAGYVVRGKNATGSGVYLANNDGKLENPGWLVTGSYDGGALQRYYIDATTHAAKVGEFVVDGKGYLGLSGVGYVLRGNATVNNKSYAADNDGELILSFSTSVATAKKKATGAIVSTFVGETPYLFLPAHSDLTSVPVSFSTFDGGSSISVSLDGGKGYQSIESGDKLDLSSLAATDGVRSVFFRTAGSTKVRTLAIMMSANVRAMYLVSDDPANKGRAYIDGSSNHSTKATGTMLLVDPDGTVVYNGELTQIKGRGNATWNLDKKPYQIKLDTKTDLIETGDKSNEAKTWVLLANRNDASALQNSVAFSFAQALGLEASSEFTPIDLYYDGEYRGSYLLCEKVEINSGRVDITKLEDANEDANPGVDLGELSLAKATNKYGQTFQYVVGMANPEDITGGYLLEHDGQYYAAERCWFTTSQGHFVVKGPEDCSYEQMKYISEFVQEAINNSGSNVSQRTGTASSYIDIDSFAKVYMVNQLAKNEGWFGSSAYFYLPSASDEGYRHVLYAGPVWDFDTAFGLLNYNELEVTSYSKPEYLMPFGYWFTSAPEVKAAVSSTLAEVANKALSAMLGGGNGSSGNGDVWAYTGAVSDVSASQSMNEKLWGYWTFDVCVDPYDNYAQNAQRLLDWLKARAAWLVTNGWI